MNSAKQKLILSYLISSPPLFALCSSMVDSAFFNPEFKNAVEFIKRYNDEFNAIPSQAQIFAESETEIELVQMTRDQIEWASREIEKFCKQRALIGAVLKSADIINEEEDSEVAGSKVQILVEKANSIRLRQRMGISLTDDLEERFADLRANPKQSTGWAEFDRTMEGGISRQELLLWSAPPKGGKSITMQNLCLNLAEQKLPVLYISLELSTKVIWKRFAQMASGIPSRELLDRASEVKHKIEELRDTVTLIVEQMPAGTRSNEIRAYLKEFELERGWIPEVLALDYLDLMYPNERDISLSDVWTKDKLATEQLRQILVDYDMYGTSASQLNRSAVNETTYNAGMIAGGISKINTTDDLVAIYQSQRMKAEGLITFQFMANRNVSVDNDKIDLAWNRNSLRITDLNKGSPLGFKPSGGKPPPFKNSALSLIKMIPKDQNSQENKNERPIG